jgi:chaperone required for assembly of F1-ATPase
MLSRMRDLLQDALLGAPLDPNEAARRGMRQRLRRRVYKQSSVEENDGVYRVVLDGRAVRTPAREVLAAPRRALAEALAAEWQAQRDVIDPARMPLNRLVNTIIDGVTRSKLAVAAELERYVASDLVFYRAEGPQALVERQAAAWDPVLAWVHAALGAEFHSTRAMMHLVQPADSLRAVAAAIPSEPWQLGALHAMTTLTGSVLIALAFAFGELSVEQAWSAAHVDEDWNMEFWGRDELALERRACRFAEMQAAAEVLRALTLPAQGPGGQDQA